MHQCQCLRMLWKRLVLTAHGVRSPLIAKLGSGDRAVVRTAEKS
jgi:hypothetical protein